MEAYIQPNQHLSYYLWIMKKKLKYITLNAYIQMGKEKMKMKDEGVVALQRFP